VQRSSLGFFVFKNVRGSLRRSELLSKYTCCCCKSLASFPPSSRNCSDEVRLCPPSDLLLQISQTFFHRSWSCGVTSAVKPPREECHHFFLRHSVFFVSLERLRICVPSFFHQPASRYPSGQETKKFRWLPPPTPPVAYLSFPHHFGKHALNCSFLPSSRFFSLRLHDVRTSNPF